MMAAAPQNDRLAKNPRKPEFVFVEGGQAHASPTVIAQLSS